ncbi:MAG: PolC-type DNA polymerase III [Lachnospiraceae bacterium]|nr:PolC-type DNA polymerase III [Lachnospiraceae bacterium]
MEKRFFDVFPTLVVSDDNRELLEETKVTKLVSSSRHDKLHIYLTSDHIIPKDRIYETEREIRKQYYRDDHVSIKIIENFSLGDTYSAGAIIKLYRNSIIDEAAHINPAWSDLMRHADFELDDEDDTIILVLEDRFLARDMADEILDYLDHAINKRYGTSYRLKASFKEKEERKSVTHMRERMREEIRRITLDTSKAEEAAKRSDDVTDEVSAEAVADEFVMPGAYASQNDDDVFNIYGNGPVSIPSAKKPDDTEAAEGKAAGNEAPKTVPDTVKEELSKKSRYSKKKAPANPDVIYGRDFTDGPMEIRDIEDDIGEVVIRGQVCSLNVRDTRTGKKMVTFAVTDFTDTIDVKLFPREDQQELLFDYLKEGQFVILKGATGVDKYDGTLSLGYIYGIKKTHDFRIKREDNEAVKRVELHCHTKMSDMDGVSAVADIIDRARSWGHDAIAVTDHGVVQAFTEAFHHVRDKKIDDLKIIYGMEGYVVDDTKTAAVNPEDHTTDDTFVVFDIETTGFSPVKNNIIEIGAVKIEGGKVIDRFSTFVNPGEPIPYRIQKLTNINDDMVKDAPFINDVLRSFGEFCEGCVYVAHNASFDMGFIKAKEEAAGIIRQYSYVDTLEMARLLVPEIARYKLDNLCKHFKVSLENHHRAVDDAEATSQIFLKLVERLKQKGAGTLRELNEMCAASDEKIRKSPSNHIIILAANETGRVNLYRLVSQSHLKYFNGHAKIPKSLITKYREGLIIGSACEQGELYQAIISKKSEDELIRIAKFYDYLEIQPNGNNEFMIREDRFEDINSVKDLEDINRKIIQLGDTLSIPVVATCDVHFLDPEDEVYRRVLMAGKGFKDADMQAPLYLRTTEEMLEEFDYLGYDKAYEVVVTNTRKIADMIERIEPVRPDKCPPVIEDSDKTLTDICYKKAREVYGDDLPPQVSARLDRELQSIISNGFAVMYIIAQKLVWKSNEDGYLVGSRGSVGSSFVATMAGITEVNPLPPHYYCSACHYVDFESDEVRAYAGRAGCDMPDKVCPVCGAPLKKEGFDIPFETFLGFEGNKEPDIDLNFSGEYQSKAHKYTEVIFGKGQTFRAGTIGTIADKTAYGFVKKYFEERNVSKRPCELDRLSKGCTGVRRTTGQHPGGIIVLPKGEDIDTFTPIQHPADDINSDIITTHFDYHSIDHNLLKLDILGHDDPTMIKMLQDITGTDPRSVMLDDKQVMSLFRSTEAIGISPEDIGGCKLGCLGIPEFGTDFVIQMLIDTKPEAFSDLVRISGLSHGTDVWLGNAQKVIEDGLATISTAICTRDDIMTYLINMGIESSLAFNIMEKVRKGNVAAGKCKEWPEWKQKMSDHGVPDWYIWSCEKIKYMFPKAHAAAYVMMAWRIAYYKINYPLAYYAAYFSIRASAFSYETMCLGKDVLHEELERYRKLANDGSVKMTSKQENTFRDLKIAEEMYARGFEFMPIDLFKADAHKCLIIDGKIMPRLDCIDGLGDKAADGVTEAAAQGRFLSLDDFCDRTKVSKTVTDHMVELGILSGLPRSNQLSLFDNM